MSGPDDVSGLNNWCAGLYRSCGVAHQGVIAPELFVSLADFESDDPCVLIEAVDQGYAEYLLEDMRFLPGEFSAVALASRGVQSYLGALQRYGHDSILNERWWDSVRAKSAAVGLAAMGSAEQADILQSFVSFVEANRERAARHLTMVDHGGERDEGFDSQMDEFDKAIDALDMDSHERRHADWLRERVTTVPTQGAALRKLATRNRKFKNRFVHRDSDQVRFSQANRSVADGLVQRLATAANKEMLRLQSVKESVLKDFVVAGHPVPVMVWSYGRHESPWDALDARDFSGYDLVITPGARGEGTALLVAPDGFIEYARLPLSVNETRKCSLGAF